MNTLHLTWERKKHSLGLDLFTVTDGRCGLICKLTAASWLLSWFPLYIIGRQCRRAQSTHVYNSCTTIYWMERTVANVCETEHKVARHAHWFPTDLAAGSDFSTKFHLWKTFLSRWHKFCLILSIFDRQLHCLGIWVWKHIIFVQQPISCQSRYSEFLNPCGCCLVQFPVALPMFILVKNTNFL